jgi:spermidine synthase
MAPLLLATVLIISTCGLVYELMAGTLASYLLGDSVTQFSTIIGAYLSAMGLGSFLSKYIDRNVARRFVEVELLVALVGGLSAPLLFLSFGHLSVFRAVLYPVVVAIGVLVGLEIPLLLRILKEQYEFKDLIARVLTFDYIGALVGSLLFPIFLVPRLGLVRTSLVFGLLNAVVGMASTWILRPALSNTRGLRVQASVVMAILVAGLIGADRLTSLAEDGMYSDEIVYTRQTHYQRVVITRGRGSFQLFLNGNLQFSSADEYRYHEALVHPAMTLAAGARRVLVLGGGDGLAVRELLKYPSVEEIVLVDLDPDMIKIARENPLVREQNHDSFSSPLVKVVNEDAYVWLQGDHGKFDAVIVDFPDPNNFSLGKLYTTRFYRMARKVLSPGAPMVVQSTSPLMARRAFWCVVRTIEEAGFSARPYHAFVPSFGEWGYVLAREGAFDVPTHLIPKDLGYLTDETMPGLFNLTRDMSSVPVETNRLNNQILVQYYETEWRRWN